MDDLWKPWWPGDIPRDAGDRCAHEVERTYSARNLETCRSNLQVKPGDVYQQSRSAGHLLIHQGISNFFERGYITLLIQGSLSNFPNYPRDHFNKQWIPTLIFIAEKAPKSSIKGWTQRVFPIPQAESSSTGGYKNLEALGNGETYEKIHENFTFFC